MTHRRSKRPPSSLSRSRRQRGFALLTIVMVVAVMGVVAGVMMTSIGDELSMIGRRKETWAARQIADSGAREMLADTSAVLPDFTTAGLVTTYTTTTSAVVDPTTNSSYTGTYRLLRFVPVAESSQNWVRAFVYEVEARSQYQGNDSSSAVKAEIYRTVAVAPGTVAPRIHAR